MYNSLSRPRWAALLIVLTPNTSADYSRTIISNGRARRLIDSAVGSCCWRACRRRRRRRCRREFTWIPRARSRTNNWQIGDYANAKSSSRSVEEICFALRANVVVGSGLVPTISMMTMMTVIIPPVLLTFGRRQSSQDAFSGCNYPRPAKIRADCDQNQ